MKRHKINETKRNTTKRNCRSWKSVAEEKCANGTARKNWGGGKTAVAAHRIYVPGTRYLVRDSEDWLYTQKNETERQKKINETERNETKRPFLKSATGEICEIWYLKQKNETARKKRNRNETAVLENQQLGRRARMADGTARINWETGKRRRSHVIQDRWRIVHNPKGILILCQILSPPQYERVLCLASVTFILDKISPPWHC